MFAAATWWAPSWPVEQAMHSSLTAVAVGVLLWVHRRVGLPVRVWVWALVFLTLHTIAARWLYSYVPYDDWTSALFGFRMSAVFGGSATTSIGSCSRPVRCTSCSSGASR